MIDIENRTQIDACVVENEHQDVLLNRFLLGTQKRGCCARTLAPRLPVVAITDTIPRHLPPPSFINASEPSSATFPTS